MKIPRSWELWLNRLGERMAIAVTDYLRRKFDIPRRGV
jgi:hypothetical protein